MTRNVTFLCVWLFYCGCVSFQICINVTSCVSVFTKRYIYVSLIFIDS